MDINNLYSLWDKHESLLNHLLFRFQMVLIKDLFQYFREPWALLLYHPKFQELMDYCNMITTSVTVSVTKINIHILISCLFIYLVIYRTNEFLVNQLISRRIHTRWSTEVCNFTMRFAAYRPECTKNTLKSCQSWR